MYRIKIHNLVVQLGYPKNYNGITVIFLPGLPMSLRDNSVFDTLVESGFAVFYPFFSGSYDSRGKFSPEQCVEDAYVLAKYVKEHSEFNELYFNTKLNLETRKLVLAGHSFGASIVALCRNELFDAKILLSPIVKYSSNEIREIQPETSFLSQMDSLLRLLRDGYPETYRVKSFLDLKNFLHGGSDDDILVGLQGVDIATLVVHGKNDKSYPWQVVSSLFANLKKQNYQQIFPQKTGHSLSSYEKRATKKIINFIRSC